MTEKSYPEFLSDLFRKYSGLNTSTISKIIDVEENLNTFVLAITHKSYDAENNYEFLEFYGDNFVNTAITEYIHKTFPDIRAEGQFTQIKHNLIKDTTFSNFAAKLGLINYIRGDQEFIFGTGEKNEFGVIAGNHVLKIQEDLFEAFIGATVIVMDKIYPHSGYSIAYKIAETLLKDIRIETRVEKIKPPKMEMNDIVCGDIVKRKFGPKKTLLEYRFVGMDGNKHVIEAVFNYGGEEIRRYEGGKSILLGTGAAVNKKAAETNAAREALVSIKRYLQ
jgi:dsRNA-specific ribonuclease